MKKTLLLFATSSLIAQASASTFTVGELDYEAEFQGGGFELKAKQVGAGPGGTNIESEANEVTVLVPNSRAFIAPGESSLIGVSTGDTFWTLPQDNIAGLPYLGLASEDLIASEWNGGITFEFLGLLAAPVGGDFSLFSTDGGSGTNTFYFSSANEAGTENGDNTFVSNFSHDHFNWAFTEPGIYEVSIGISGDNVASGAVTGGGTMVFNVIPEPSSTLLAGLGLAVGLIRRRR